MSPYFYDSEETINRRALQWEANSQNWVPAQATRLTLAIVKGQDQGHSTNFTIGKALLTLTQNL